MPAHRGDAGTSAPTQRVVALDVLRAIAVILVFGRHMIPPRVESSLLQEIIDAWHRGGWVGVDLFFVLSGFLISGLLFREHAKYGRIHIKRFLIRRGLKIYPPFYTLLAITMIVGVAMGDLPSPWGLLGELLYLQNYIAHVWNHTWSLAVEEHFYLLLPGVLLLLSRHDDRFRRLPAFAALVMIACLGLRLIQSVRVPEYANLAHMFPTHLRLDGLMLGVLLSWIHEHHSARFHAISRSYSMIMLMGGAALLAPSFIFELEETPFVYTVGLTLNAIGAGLIMVGFLGRESDRPKRRGALAYLGFYSYSIYLWHMPVQRWIMPALGLENSLATALLYMAISCALGIGMAKLVEMPVLRLRDRFFPSRSAPIPTFAGEGMDVHGNGAGQTPAP